MKHRSTAGAAFIASALANGNIVVDRKREPEPEDVVSEDPLWYLRPVRLETVRERQHKYTGCKSAGCRTFKECICRCKDCVRWCKYRGVTIIDDGGTVFIRFANGRLIVSMPREEYESVKVHWEKLDLKLVEAPVTPV